MLEKSPREIFPEAVGDEARRVVRYVTGFSKVGFGNDTVALLTEIHYLDTLP